MCDRPSLTEALPNWAGPPGHGRPSLTRHTLPLMADRATPSSATPGGECSSARVPRVHAADAADGRVGRQPRVQPARPPELHARAVHRALISR
eukprot:2918443-Prymnesium_polylepis.1